MKTGRFRRSGTRIRAGCQILLCLLAAAESQARGYRWTSNGPDGGTVVSIAFGPDAIYCTAGQEIFRSTDQGVSWLGTGVRGVYTITAAPSDRRILYAMGDKAYRSGDGGATWSEVTTALPGNFELSLAVDAADPNLVYAGFFGSVYRSSDGGRSWRQTSLTSVAPVSIATDPVRSGIVFAASPDPWACPDSCAFHVYGIWKSADGGGSWSQPPDLSPDLQFPYSIAVDPVNSDMMYVGVLGYVEGKSLFKSIDAGAHWSEADTGMHHLAGVSFVSAVAVDPNNPSIVYASSDEGFWKSTDGAATWGLLFPAGALAESIGVDPSGSSRVFASDYSFGLRRSLDGGRTWQAANAGRPFTAIRCLSGDPSDPLTVYSGTDGDGLFRTRNSGASWEPVAGDLSFDSVSGVAVDPADSTRIYATLVQHGIFRSTDSGVTWVSVYALTAYNCCSNGIEANPSVPGEVFATGFEGLLVSHDSGESWNLLHPGIWKVIVEPRRSGWLYAIGTTQEGASAAVLRSTDDGSTWSAIGPGVNVQAIALDPTDPDVLYCGAGGSGFFKTADGGQTWTTSLIWTNSIAVLPGTPQRIFVGTFQQGVFESTDSGAHWNSINEGLTDPYVTSLLSAGGLIHAGTASAAVFEYLPNPDHLSPITTPPPFRVGER